jgi:hypothetical protein
LRCNDDKECANSYYSCWDVKKTHKSNDPDNGFYTINIDKDWTDSDKKIPNGEVEVLCDFYDGRAFTLYETVSNKANPDGTAPYDMRGKKARHPNVDSNIGKIFKANPNNPARCVVVGGPFLARPRGCTPFWFEEHAGFDDRKDRQGKELPLRACDVISDVTSERKELPMACSY